MSAITRRELVKAGALAAAALPLGGARPAAAAATGGDGWRGLKAGVASYTLRKLPLEAAIPAIQRVGLSYVSIKDFHLPLNSTAEERKAVAAKFKAAGITPLSCGNITMQNDAANVRRPSNTRATPACPPSSAARTPPMPILDAMVKEFDIRLAIHNHGPEDKRFPSPHDVWKAVERYDRRIGFCIDVGHTARAKVDPAEAIRRYKDRLYDLHCRTSTATARRSRRRGVLDLESILQAILDVRYPHLFSFGIREGRERSRARAGESIGYTRPAGRMAT